MTTKHTPGPWKIGALESGQAAVDGANGEEVTGFVSIPDAHLIAAAPELLEALERVERRARVSGECPLCRQPPEVGCSTECPLTAARAAIAKATGGKP